MKINLKSFIAPMSLGLFVLLFSVSICNPTLAIGWEKGSKSEETFKILSVLENKMGDQKLLEKAKGKVFILSDRQISLISSLSERIVSDGHTTGADFAFLLIMVLIVLS